MRAEQWAMTGVVGLGLYALYRMIQSPKTLPSSEDDIPILSLPQVPGAVIVPASVLRLETPSELRRNDWASGRIETIGVTGEKTVDTDPMDWGLAQRLTSLGFGGSAARPDAPNAFPPSVLVFGDPNAARKAGVPTWALANPGRGTRWFYGRWTVDAGPETWPPWMTLVWRASPPRRS